MGSTETRSADAGKSRRLISDALIRWISGNQPAADHRVWFLESAAHAGTILDDFAAPGDVVFAPSGADPRAVGYDGSLAEPGDEIVIADEIFVHTQDYLSIAYQAVAGPTVVRVTGPHDFEVFGEDAELARREGVFAEQLVHPSVVLADQCALGLPRPTERLDRVHVTESGEFRAGPSGPVIGSIDAPPRTWDSLDSQGKKALSAVLDATLTSEAHAARPWLARYLTALDALRSLRRGDTRSYRVSGFGARLVDSLPLDRPEDSTAPLLLWAEDRTLLYQPGDGRWFEVGQDAARLVELLSVSGDDVAAAARLAVEHLGLTAEVATEALTGLTTRLTTPRTPVTTS
ncbi:daptide biosynthesis RiPP recognition protein [Amycolatopsis sp. NPDC059021]|uniref:daptide biosynthesis RiPP recognition protein n=1 Tax=Amycolatopsis sp. NPDC059021 TaxID=3346704 RepID=UPI00366F9E48